MKAGPLSLGKVIEGIARKRRWYGRFRLAEVLKIWEEAVGEGIASHAQPHALRRGTLTVICSGPQWMHQLYLMKEMIRERLNETAGKELVRDIRFRVGAVRGPEKAPVVPAPPLSDEDRRWIEEVLSPLKDEGLRDALRRVLEKARAKRR